MSINIVQVVPLQNQNGIFSPPGSFSSTVGNTLVLLIDWNSTGGSDTNSSVTDNLVQSWNKINGASSGGGDVWYGTSLGGTVNNLNVHEPAFFNSWLYELYSNSGPITLSNLNTATSGGINASSITFSIGTQSITFTPDFPAELEAGGAVFTDGVDNFYVAGCNYFASPSTGTTKIASASAPWTLDAYVVDPYSYFYDFGAAHYKTAAASLSVMPSNLNFVNEVFGDQSGHGFIPHIGGGGSAGTDHGQQISLISSGTWSVQSAPSWLLIQPSSGSGNTNITINLLDKGLPRGGGLNLIKQGVYSGTIVFTNGSNAASVNVSYTVGWGSPIAV